MFSIPAPAPLVFALWVSESLLHSYGPFALFNAWIAIIFMVGIGLQQTLLGEVKDHERDRVAEVASKVLLKNVLFIFYVLSPETFPELLLWLGWLCCLSLLKVLCEFCRLRLAGLRQSPILTPNAVLKLSLFIALTFTLTTTDFLFVIYAFRGHGPHPLLFLLYEPFYMLMDLAQVTVKFGIHLRCLQRDIPADEPCHFTDMVCSVAKLSVAVAHYSHVLAYIFSMSIVDLVLVVYLRHLLRLLVGKVDVLCKYNQALRVIKETLPSASLEQVQQYADPCAICYDALVSDIGASTTSEAATSPPRTPAWLAPKVLSCNHIFHLRCIRQWMEHQHCCPICKQEVLPSSQGPSSQHPTSPAPTAELPCMQPTCNSHSTHHS